MPRGIDAKREREFKVLTRRFKDEHRYPGREQEVAARIVNKQRKAYGETAAEKHKDRVGMSPDRRLPITDYDGLTIPQVTTRLDGLSASQLRHLQRYEHAHKNRKSLLATLARRLSTH